MAAVLIFLLLLVKTCFYLFILGTESANHNLIKS